MRRRRRNSNSVILALAFPLAACGGDDRERDSSDPSAGLTFTAGNGTAGDDDEEGDDDDDDEILDLGNAGDEGPGNNGCEEIIEEAALGAQAQDIIFVIDTSGSMVQESAFVQEQMNSFSIQITAANVDARIILLAEYPPFGFGPGVCIDPPLGSGGCPATDSNPPEFLHVPDSDIGSSNALMRLLELFPAYSPFLRPTALAHLVVVSDDNSAMPADDFVDQWGALSPHLVNFVAHGIIASEDPDAACNAGTACCQLAAQQGMVYQDLIALTGGVEGNLCDQEFQPIFQAVAQQVVAGASLSCNHAIPDPPDGEAFDKDQVNVEFEDGMGGTLEIGRVDDPALCSEVSDGWYYDDPEDPSVIFVCPQTCDKIQGFQEASIAIKFGCATIPAG